MSQPVFFLSNPNRKSKFLIETTIYQEKEGSFVEKKAGDPMAIEHIEYMMHTYKTLSSVDGLGNKINIISPLKISSGTLRFDFVDGISAERLLLEKILLDDSIASFAIIDKLFSYIDDLPSTKINPTKNPNYVEVFGWSYDKTMNCTNIGIIDINLDNIVIDKVGRWNLFDYEWMFEFPVPTKFLQMRFMWTFLYRHREILRYHSQRIESLRDSTGTLYIPKFIYNEYKQLFNGFEDLCSADLSFQVYVSGKVDKNLALIKEAGFKTEEANSPVVGIEEVFEKKSKATADEIKRSRSYVLAKKINSIIKYIRFWN